MRRWRLFLIPEEIRSPQVIKYLQEALSKRRQNQQMDGFLQVVVEPYANAIHVGLLRGKKPKSSEPIERNRNLRELALGNGPATLSKSDRMHLLRDSESMALLHRQVWRVSDRSLANQWGLGELQ